MSDSGDGDLRNVEVVSGANVHQRWYEFIDDDQEDEENPALNIEPADYGMC